MCKKKYRPSNGSEGMGFMENFCEQCIHEKYSHTMNTNDLTCDILSNTMVYDIDEPEYPSEWIYDENGKPTCTAWVKWDWGNDEDGWNEPPEKPVDDPNQLCLPFEVNEILKDHKKTEEPELVT